MPSYLTKQGRFCGIEGARLRQTRGLATSATGPVWVARVGKREVRDLCHLRTQRSDIQAPRSLSRASSPTFGSFPRLLSITDELKTVALLYGARYELIGLQLSVGRLVEEAVELIGQAHLRAHRECQIKCPQVRRQTRRTDL